MFNFVLYLFEGNLFFLDNKTIIFTLLSSPYSNMKIQFLFNKSKV
jgi:hypothetical protein